MRSTLEKISSRYGFRQQERNFDTNFQYFKMHYRTQFSYWHQKLVGSKSAWGWRLHPYEHRQHLRNFFPNILFARNNVFFRYFPFFSKLKIVPHGWLSYFEFIACSRMVTCWLPEVLDPNDQFSWVISKFPREGEIWAIYPPRAK